MSLYEYVVVKSGGRGESGGHEEIVIGTTLIVAKNPNDVHVKAGMAIATLPDLPSEDYKDNLEVRVRPFSG